MLITGCQNLKIGISLITMHWNMCRGVRRAQKIKGERSGTHGKPQNRTMQVRGQQDPRGFRERVSYMSSLGKPN